MYDGGNIYVVTSVMGGLNASVFCYGSLSLVILSTSIGRYRSIILYINLYRPLRGHFLRSRRKPSVTGKAQGESIRVMHFKFNKGFIVKHFFLSIWRTVAFPGVRPGRVRAARPRGREVGCWKAEGGKPHAKAWQEYTIIFNGWWGWWPD